MKKKLNEEDYPQPNYNPTKIISSILIDEFKGVSVNFTKNDVFSFGTIFRIIYIGDSVLSEGDVINIKTVDDFPTANPDFSKTFLNRLVELILRRFSYNFTFLIELDPL